MLAVTRTLTVDQADDDLRPTRYPRPARTNERREAINTGLGFVRHRTDVRSRWSR